MGEIHNLSTDLPVLGRFDEFLKRGESVARLWRSGYHAEEGGMEAARAWLKRDQHLTLLLPSLDRDLAVLQRKATRTDIVDALSPLGVLPKNRDAPPNVASVLAQRVASREPTFGAINIAALQVLDNAKWYPLPVDLLTALDEANKRLASIRHAIDKIPSWRERVVEALAEAERSQAFQSKRRAAQIAYG